MKPITESHIEQSAIEALQAQGWAYVNGKEANPIGKVANNLRILLNLPSKTV